MIPRPRTCAGQSSVARLPRVRKPMRLLGHWNTVMGKIAASRQILLCLDFDGTLVAIEPRPELVRLHAATRRILIRLSSHRRVQIAIISARRRREIQSLVAIEGIGYLGLYGWERDEHAKLPALARRALRRCHLLLAQRLRLFPSLWIEDKEFTVSIHLKDVGAALERWARNETRKLVANFDRYLRVAENLRDIEVIPRVISDKGKSVRALLAGRPPKELFPFYFGDDCSDEPAFAAAAHGVTVHVGRTRPTRAAFSLRGPAEVTRALKQLEAALG